MVLLSSYVSYCYKIITYNISISLSQERFEHVEDHVKHPGFIDDVDRVDLHRETGLKILYKMSNNI